MGRKIPAKKHRGVKDPLKQQARRFQRLGFNISLHLIIYFITFLKLLSIKVGNVYHCFPFG